jgi:hypothetical protein
MKWSPKIPARPFPVGGGVVLKDCGALELAVGEQVTLTTPSGTEFDVVRKSWGYYGTPSLNDRLPKKGLRPVLGKNAEGKYFLWLVERDKEREFETYLHEHGLVAVIRLDEPAELGRLEGG